MDMLPSIAIPLILLATSPAAAELGPPSRAPESEPDAVDARRQDDGELPPCILIQSQRPGEDEHSSGGGVALRYGLTRSDFRHLQEIPGIAQLIPWRAIRMPVKRNRQETTAEVLGANAEFSRILESGLARGRFLVDADIRTRQNVVVLGADVEQKLFQQEDPLGKEVRIDSEYFTVVGVLEAAESPDGPLGLLPSADSCIYMPISTMRSRFGDRVVLARNGTTEIEEFELSSVVLVVNEAEMVQEIAQAAGDLLQERHEAVDYRITVMDGQQKQGS